jgi:4-carboxymuconolactone decarboxylase
MRITPIEPGTRPELAQQEARIAAERGRVSGLYQVLLNSPPIAHGWEQMLSAVRNRSSLSADVRELIILRVAVLNQALYEFDAHAPIALREGLSQQAIDHVKAMPFDPHHAGIESARHLYSPVQIAALKMTDTMTREIKVPDALFDEIKGFFNDQQKVDLAATVGAYNMVSRFLEALQVGH